MSTVYLYTLLNCGDILYFIISQAFAFVNAILMVKRQFVALHTTLPFFLNLFYKHNWYLFKYITAVLV